MPATTARKLHPRLVRKLAACKRPQNQYARTDARTCQPTLAWLTPCLTATGKDISEWNTMDAGHWRAQWIMEHNAHAGMADGETGADVSAWMLFEFDATGAHRIVREFARG